MRCMHENDRMSKSFIVLQWRERLRGNHKAVARREKKRPSRVLKLQIRLAKEMKDENDDKARKHFARLKPLQFNTGGQ